MLQSSKSEFVEVIIDDNSSRGIGHNGVEVTINRQKCNYSMYDPSGCKKCLQLCPVGVFSTRPIEKRDFSIPPKERIDPTTWIILATWADWCNGCAACVKECPKGAISIRIGERQLTPPKA
jgi:ferredoxin